MSLAGRPMFLWAFLLVDVFAVAFAWDAQGMIFELTFISNFRDSALYIHILGRENTLVTIDGPFSSLPVETMIGPMKEVSYELSTTFSVDIPVTYVQKKGISIETTNNVTVYILNYVSTTSDGCLLLPVQPVKDGVLTHYMAVAYASESQSILKSLLGIVAFYNQTTVTFTLRLAKTGVVIFQKRTYKNRDTFDVILDKHDVIQLVSNSDLTGTMVDSNKPISLFSGANCVNVPATVQTCDYIMEQIPPISDWGVQFVTSPLKSRSAGDVFRIVAAQDQTSVQIDESPVFLNQGEFYEWEIASNESVFISSTQNILLVQYAKSYYADMTGDPAMLIVPAIDQFEMFYRLYLPHGFLSFASLVVPTSAVASIVVDQHFLRTDATVLTTVQAVFNVTSVQLPFGHFVTTENKLNMTVLQITLGSGQHTIWSPNNTQFGLQAYGFGLNSNPVSYGFTAGGRSLHVFGLTCKLQPCMNDAICLDFEDTFVCICKFGFFGSLCSETKIISAMSVHESTTVDINSSVISAPDSVTFQTTPSVSTSAEISSNPLTIDATDLKTSVVETSKAFSMSPLLESVFPITVQMSQQTSEPLVTVSRDPTTIQSFSGHYETSVVSGIIQTELASSTSWVITDSSSAVATPLLTNYGQQTTVIDITETAQMDSVLITPHTPLIIPSTAYTTNSVSSMCSCTCLSKAKMLEANNKSEEEIKLIIQEIQSNLTVNTVSLSSRIRKKISVYDQRPSATRVGVSGLAVLSFLFGALVLIDCTTVKKSCLILKNNL